MRVRGPGGDINYPEVQLMIPRQKKAEQTPIVVTGGEGTDTPIHAFWHPTYETPGFIETDANGDPGILELFGGLGAYWQIILPEDWIVDRITWYNDELINYGPPDVINWALYDLNQAEDSFPLLAQTGIQVLSAAPFGVNTYPLDQRLSLPGGLYAVALAMPCHKIASVGSNQLAYGMVNLLWSQPRYGTFTTADGSMPDVLDSGNVIPYTGGDTTHDITIVGHAPIAYFDDSQVFAV